MSVRIEQLKKRRDASMAAAQQIIDTADSTGQSVTQEQQQRFDDLLKEYHAADDDVARHEQLETAKSRLDRVTRQIQPEPIASPPGVYDADVRVVRHSGELRSFHGPHAREDAYRAGRWMQAAIFGNEAARTWCDGHGMEFRVMTGGVNTAGGFLVPTEIERAIINLRESYGIARQECRVVRMGSDHQVIPRRASGVTARALGETTEIIVSDMAWSQVELVARKWGALTRVSSDLREDAVIDVADTVADEMAWAFAKKEDESLIDGDGTSTYHGVVGIRPKMVDGNHGGTVTDATANDDNFVELLAADLATLTSTLPDYAEPRAKWYVSRYAWGACFIRLLAAMGGNTLEAIVRGARVPQYLGYPVVIVNAMPGYTATNHNDEVMVLFGDMSKACTFGDRRGITMKISEDRYLEYDQVGIQATERFDIVAHDLGDATTAGPLVGLLGTS